MKLYLHRNLPNSGMSQTPVNKCHNFKEFHNNHNVLFVNNVNIFNMFIISLICVIILIMIILIICINIHNDHPLSSSIISQSTTLPYSTLIPSLVSSSIPFSGSRTFTGSFVGAIQESKPFLQAISQSIFESQKVA